MAYRGNRINTMINKASRSFPSTSPDKIMIAHTGYLLLLAWIFPFPSHSSNNQKIKKGACRKCHNKFVIVCQSVNKFNWTNLFPSTQTHTLLLWTLQHVSAYRPSSEIAYNTVRYTRPMGDRIPYCVKWHTWKFR